MKLETIKNSWKQENEQIASNVQLNKDTLIKKLTKETDRMKRKSLLILLFRIVFPLVIFCILLINLPIYNRANFYLGMVLFLAFAGFTISGMVNYYRKLRKLDITESYLENKKKISELELYKLKITKRNYCSIPIGIIGIFLLISAPIFTTTEGIIMLILIMAIMMASIVVNLKYILPTQFKKLKREIESIREWEKE